MRRRLLASYVMFLLTLTAVGQQQVRSERGKFEISGKLVNALSGEVIHNAFVQLAPATQPGQMRRSEVSVDGSFAFDNLTPGKYSLMAQARNFPQQFLDEHQGFSTAVAVGPDKTSTGIVFRLRPQSSISGRVLDEHNEPAREAQVMLFQRNSDLGKRRVEMRGQEQTNDLGEYHFNHLGPGTYYLAVSAQPWYRRYYLQQFPRKRGDQQDNDSALDVAYPLTFYADAFDSEGASAIVLRAGDRISADFNLTPVQALHLTLPASSPTGGYAPNLQYLAFGEPVNVVQSNVMGREDELQMSGIPPGDYLLTLHSNDGKNHTQRMQNVSLRQSGALDISSAENLEGIHGTVTFDGGPPPNTFLQVVDSSSGRQMGARIDEKGEFTINPEQPGRLTFGMINAPGYVIRTITAPAARVNGRTVEFTGKEPLEISIKVSRGVGRVNGTVMSGDKPVSGTMVVLVPEEIGDNLTLFRRDQSDSDGTFTLPDVVPGRYTVLALQNGWEMEWASADALRPYLSRGTPVQISGQEQVDIKVAAQ
ncbi:MAG TPA: carboxypeptidase-like regulatory domain-containing protein [Terriglobales bacterium]|nr:carboxypeptidase-like regulatory domain-containing protein [Terriglobales bacterium]